MNDANLERLAKQMGARPAAAIDPQKTAWAVLTRLRSSPQQRPWWRRVGLVPVAAAATLMLASGLAIRQWVSNGGSGMTLPVPVELQDLAHEELAEVLDSLEWEVPVSELVPLTLADLSESELQELLQAMEG